MEQGHLEVALERRHLPAHGRLAHVQRVARMRKAAGGGRGMKNPKFVPVRQPLLPAAAYQIYRLRDYSTDARFASALWPVHAHSSCLRRKSQPQEAWGQSFVSRAASLAHGACGAVRSRPIRRRRRAPPARQQIALGFERRHAAHAGRGHSLTQNTSSLTSPAAKTPGMEVAVESGAVIRIAGWLHLELAFEQLRRRPHDQWQRRRRRLHAP